ncbi:MAG: S-layer homology domain-containing protein [Acidimicrobiaceae bacterium]|nr:S-layer homology domain-containing protein [Acidimicrobiaceae bacterium]
MGPALADQMFTDVSDMHAFKDAINCIAYYGITNGTGDGSTYSPNQDVTRAEMAVFIARAAGVAGVDVGMGSGGFSDIGDVWQEAQDAINALAGNGMIPSGGEFRPDDAITRAEMAAFLIGLLAEGAPNVTINQDGVILLGTGGAAAAADDYFADARAAVPRAVDAQISALYELGVTKGASALPGGPGRSHVLVSTYTNAIIDTDPATDGFQRSRNPQGASIVSTVPLTLNDDGNASFSVSGLVDSAPGVKSDKYEVDIRVQHTPPPGATGSMAVPPLPYNYDPHGKVNRGEMAAFITRALAHTQARPEGVTAQFSGGNVVVSVRDENYAPVSNVVVDLFRIDTPGLDLAFRANGTCNEAGPMDSSATTGYTCEIDGTDHITDADGDARVPLGDSVDDGGTTVWIWTGDDEEKVGADSELFQLDISEAEAAEPATGIMISTEHGGEKAHLGSSVLYTVQIVDKNGKPAKGYARTLPFVNADNATLTAYAAAQGGQSVVADSATGVPADSPGAVIFSTEDGVLNAGDINVKVEPSMDFAVVDNRGADNRVKVTVTDQYGDPISGVEVRVDSDDTDTANTATEIVVAGRYLSVGRNGSFSFGYERDGAVSAAETLTATISPYDHDGDGCTQAQIDDAANTACTATNTAPLVSDTSGDPLVAAGRATVEWAVVDTDGEATAQQIRAFDTEMNTIFVGAVGANGLVQFVSYDSNDRFNIDLPAVDGGDDPPNAPASYGAFERALSKADGYTLTWTYVGRGSRATNTFNLVVPAG